MKSNYERVQFWIKYIVVWAIGLAVLWLIGTWLLFIDSYQIMVIGALLTIIMLIVGMLNYKQYVKMLNQIEDISALMTQVMDEGFTSTGEALEEGSMGILYSNFYKMVNALIDSRRREIHEKVFLRDIISDISHQLKTPLASLNIFIDLLLEDKLDADKKHQVMVEASKQLDRMEWMVLSMLKLARIEAKSIVFDKTETELSQVVNQAVDGVRNLLSVKNQKISITGIDDIKFNVDGDWLTEALINLLKNASDYSPENSEITVRAEDNKVYTRIFVKDNGIGISEKDQPHIFDRFYRAKQNVNPDSVGIGLSLTKSIVEGMGGIIKVKSEEGKYTQFMITFIK